MKPKTIIGLVVIAGFVGMLLFSFGNQVGGYMSFADAEASGSNAHVIGDWVEDRPTNYDPEANIFTFYMEDESGNVREVRYRNPKPENFEEAEELVVEGYMNEEAFVAEHILVKCPSKYNDELEEA